MYNSFYWRLNWNENSSLSNRQRTNGHFYTARSLIIAQQINLRKTNGHTHLSLEKDSKTISAIYFEEKKIEEVNLPGEGGGKVAKNVCHIYCHNKLLYCLHCLLDLHREGYYFIFKTFPLFSLSIHDLSVEHGEGGGHPFHIPVALVTNKMQKGQNSGRAKGVKKM